MVKINEVAEAAGVSISTVSYALSGKRPISADTRLPHREAVRELGYSPNAGARMLAGSRTQIFALTEPLRKDTHAPTHMAFVLATAVAARRNDYDILLLTDEDAKAGMGRVAANGLVDAILVLDVAPDDERVALARAISTPDDLHRRARSTTRVSCASTWTSRPRRRSRSIGSPMRGTRPIGLIGHPDVSYEMSNFPPRVRSAFEARAQEREVAHVSFGTTGTKRTSRSATRRTVAASARWRGDGVRPALHRRGARVVLADLAERGLRVPEDISIVSVGGSFDAGSARDTARLHPPRARGIMRPGRRPGTAQPRRRPTRSGAAAHRPDLSCRRGSVAAVADSAPASQRGARPLTARDPARFSTRIIEALRLHNSTPSTHCPDQRGSPGKECHRWHAPLAPTPSEGSPSSAR